MGSIGGMFGGGGKGGSTKPPDFANAAAMTSLSSRPDWQGPMGGQSWQIDPKTGKATMQVNSAFQPTYNALQGATQQAANLDPTQARNQAIQSNYNQAASRLDPQWGQNQQQFQSQMANMGGSDNPMAGAQAAGNFNRAQNDAYQSAMNNAIQMGNQTQQVQQAQQMLPFQQLGALQGAQSSSMNVPMGQAADYSKAAENQYTAQRAQAAQQGSGKGNLLGMAGGIAGSIFGGPLGGMAGSALGNGLGGALGGGGGGGKG